MMRLLQEKPEMSQRELAHELDVCLGAAHYCLNALVDKGLVKIGNFARSEHKQHYAYMLTPARAAENARLTQRFLKRKWAEYASLGEEIEALEKEVAGSGEPEVAE